ncbi:hypothetical protein CK485_15095 [Streptomyces sp. ICBB 8177]|nr:hypothetical protein CK485_15095 [Streptomyces sp. ICBB 8177]
MPSTEKQRPPLARAGTTPVPAPRAAAPTTARRVAVPLATLAGAGAAFAYVGAVNPNQPGHYPGCPFLAVTGLYCPACGGTRCAWALVHGDLGTALRDNALAVVGFGVCAVLWVLWLRREALGRSAPGRLRMPRAGWWALGAVVLAFTVVRNLPFGHALAP